MLSYIWKILLNCFFGEVSYIYARSYFLISIIILFITLVFALSHIILVFKKNFCPLQTSFPVIVEASQFFHAFPTFSICLFIYFKFNFGCAGSLLLCMGFLQGGEAGAALQLGCSGFLLQWLLLWQQAGARAQRLSSCGGRMGLIALWCVGWQFSGQGLNPCPLCLQVAV